MSTLAPRGSQPWHTQGWVRIPTPVGAYALHCQPSLSRTVQADRARGPQPPYCGSQHGPEHPSAFPTPRPGAWVPVRLSGEPGLHLRSKGRPCRPPGPLPSPETWCGVWAPLGTASELAPPGGHREQPHRPTAWRATVAPSQAEAEWSGQKRAGGGCLDGSRRSGTRPPGGRSHTLPLAETWLKYGQAALDPVVMRWLPRCPTRQPSVVPMGRAQGGAEVGRPRWRATVPPSARKGLCAAAVAGEGRREAERRSRCRPEGTEDGEAAGKSRWGRRRVAHRLSGLVNGAPEVSGGEDGDCSDEAGALPASEVRAG